jgi:hypothetical protein
LLALLRSVNDLVNDSSDSRPIGGRAGMIRRRRNGYQVIVLGRHRGSAARTVAELLDAWLAWRQAGGKPISPQTVNDYRGLVERKLKPGLGMLRLAQLDTQRLDRFYGGAPQDRQRPERWRGPQRRLGDRSRGAWKCY